MVQFLKTTLACFIGSFITVLLFVFLGFLFLGSIIIFSEKSTPYISKDNTVLHLKLKGVINDRVEQNMESLVNIEDRNSVMGLNDLLKAIDIATTDNNIKGIYIEEIGFETGYATLQELRNKLKDFKKNGKFIYAYADSYSQKGYYLASVADSLFLNPMGSVALSGLSAQPVFFKNTLEKLGIEMQIFRVGSFKSAVEPFTLDKMSPENRIQTELTLNTIWNNIASSCAKSRNLSLESINNAADSLSILLPANYFTENKLVSGLTYRDEIEDKLTLACKCSESNELNFVSPQEIVLQINSQPYKEAPTIAILYAEGEIGTDNSAGINSQKLVDNITEIKKDENINGVVIRVNSPGGSAFASEQIWHAIKELSKEKTVAVSMGNYAASGGYYIASAADRIFAHATTITGSIGIFGMIPNAEKLLTDKIGLSFDEVKTNTYGTFPTLYRPMTTSEKAAMQASVNRGYELFVARCAEGRHKTTDEIKAIAGGRVWSGVAAKKIGLVDELGGIDNAIDWVAKDAELSIYNTVEYPAPKTPMDIILDWWNNSLVQIFSDLNISEKDLSQQLLDRIKTMSGNHALLEWRLAE